MEIDRLEMLYINLIKNKYKPIKIEQQQKAVKEV